MSWLLKTGEQVRRYCGDNCDWPKWKNNTVVRFVYTPSGLGSFLLIGKSGMIIHLKVVRASQNWTNTLPAGDLYICQGALARSACVEFAGCDFAKATCLSRSGIKFSNYPKDFFFFSQYTVLSPFVSFAHASLRNDKQISDRAALCIIAYEYLVVIATVGFILSLLQAEVKTGSQTHTAWLPMFIDGAKIGRITESDRKCRRKSAEKPYRKIQRHLVPLRTLALDAVTANRSYYTPATSSWQCYYVLLFLLVIARYVPSCP